MVNTDCGIMWGGRLMGMDGKENFAPFVVDMFAKAREITEFSVAVPTLGEATFCIRVLIELAGRLINWSGFVVFMSLGHVAEHGGAVRKVHTTFRAWRASAGKVRQLSERRVWWINQCGHDPLPSRTVRSSFEGIRVQCIYRSFIVKLPPQRCKGGEESPLLEGSLVRLPRHVDRISNDEADLTHELVGQSLRALWGETARIEAVDGGSVNTCLPYP